MAAVNNFANDNNQDEVFLLEKNSQNNLVLGRYEEVLRFLRAFHRKAFPINFKN